MSKIKEYLKDSTKVDIAFLYLYAIGGMVFGQPKFYFFFFAILGIRIYARFMDFIITNNITINIPQSKIKLDLINKTTASSLEVSNDN